ncbi:MAG: DMT family transporter [Wenzhouxiangella sp.]
MRLTAAALSALALMAFAANSLLARQALTATAIDPVSFTVIRLCSGAVMLAVIVAWRAPSAPGRFSVASSLALLAYALGFSWAYLALGAATGALLLFGAVQLSMLAWALWQGDRFDQASWLGFLMAAGGLVWLLLPGLQQPPLMPAVAMVIAGMAWAVYTLRGAASGEPLRANCGNFLLASLLALPLLAIFWPRLRWDVAGFWLAVASGALASGLGYAVWYAALARIRRTTAAVAQLLVPVITAVLAVVLLGEALSSRLLLAGLAILGGILLVVAPWRRSDASDLRAQ